MLARVRHRNVHHTFVLCEAKPQPSAPLRTRALSPRGPLRSDLAPVAFTFCSRLHRITSNRQIYQPPRGFTKQMTPFIVRTSFSTSPSSTAPERATNTKLTLSERWTLTKQRFQQKKVQFMMEYGSTFIFLHELLGITSYLVVFSLIHFKVIDVDTILGVFGWNEAYLLEKFGIDAHGLFTKWALTIATVKARKFHMP